MLWHSLATESTWDWTSTGSLWSIQVPSLSIRIRNKSVGLWSNLTWNRFLLLLIISMGSIGRGPVLIWLPPPCPKTNNLRRIKKNRKSRNKKDIMNKSKNRNKISKNDSFDLISSIFRINYLNRLLSLPNKIWILLWKSRYNNLKAKKLSQSFSSPHLLCLGMIAHYYNSNFGHFIIFIHEGKKEINNIPS